MKSLWQRLLIGIGIAAIARGGFLFAVECLEQWQLARITLQTEALKADFDSREYSRPVLRGKPEEGNAWDHYLPALFELDAEDKFSNVYVNILRDYVWEWPTADRTKVEELLLQYGPVLERLRQGTHRVDTRFPYDWSIDHILPGVEFGHPKFRYDWKKDWDHRNPHLEHQAVYFLGRAQARWLREMGRSMEAAALLMDLCVFERDRAHNDYWNTHGHVGGLQDELQALLVSRTLTRTEFARLADELAILTQHGPDNAHLFSNAMLKLGMDFREEFKANRKTRQFGSGDSEVTAGLRDLYSYRLLNARAFWRASGWSESLGQGVTLEWNKARAVEREVRQEIERADQPFELLTNVPTLSAQIQREEAVQLLLLRAGAHYLATGEILELPDPFGSGALKWKAGDSLKIWSLGLDGTDHQGRGDWRGRWNGDLVLEVDLRVP